MAEDTKEGHGIGENGAIVAVVAFDDCISLTSEEGCLLKPNRGCFQTLSKWKSLGCEVYIDGGTIGCDTEKARAWCANCGFETDGVVYDGWSAPYASMFFRIGPDELGVPIRQDRYGRYAEHVDWKKVDSYYTPVILKL